MLRWLCLTMVLGALFPSASRAATFPTCADAETYGENSARYYVASSFARIACDETRLPAVHDALARMLATQVLRTSDGDEIKLCFYQGLWTGLTSQLGTEYERCGASGSFACIDRAALANDAGSVLKALSAALKIPESFGAANVTSVYGAAPSAGVPWCDAMSIDACTQIIDTRAGAAGVRYADAVDDVAALVCSANDAGVPSDASVPSEDAGVVDLDAGP